MKADFALGQYFPVNSPLHRIDPRVKIIFIAIFTIVLLLIQNLYGLLLTLLFVMLILTVAQIPFSITLRAIKAIAYMILLTIIFQSFVSSKPYFYIGSVGISKPGFIYGLFISFRLLILLVGASLLTLTSTTIELTDGINSLLSPLRYFKVPVYDLAMMMGIAMRFIPVISAEANSIIRAQSSRGACFNAGNILTRAKNYIPVIIPLFVSVFRRADELAEAMDSRGFRGGANRTRMRQLKLSRYDIMASIVAFIALAVCLWIGRLPL